jgi:cell division protein FtsQ
VIRIDASDDPPDAVYLAAGDPLLAAMAARTRPPVETSDAAADAPVFIDDQALERGETISLADASSATRIEPRMRERRIAVKRAVGRKRLRWVLVAVVVVALVVAALAVLGSSLFAIDEVRVDGAVYTDPVALQAVVDDLEGTPVLRADTDRAERALEAIPWVADARVTAQFPGSATIELREREAVATYQGPDQRFRVIDVDGRVLDVLDAQPAEYLAITSPDAADLEPGQFTAQGFIAAANLVQALTPELRLLAQSVAVTGNGSDLRLAITDGREVRFGPGRDLVAKLVRLQTRLAQVDAGGFQYLDVSTNEVTTG